jgi:hypothetical protein
MILTEDDIPIYCPTVTLTGDALDGAIALTQSLIESEQGAGRKLEINTITEILPLNEFQSCFLTTDPILSLVSVQARTGKFRDMTGFPYQSSPWRDVDEEDYTLDENELTLVTSEAFFNGWNTGYGIRSQVFLTQAKVSYSTGFDFADDTDPDVRYIKANAGQILNYLQGSNYQGVKGLKVPFREFEIQFADSPPGEIPKSLFIPFHRYQPIKYSC